MQVRPRHFSALREISRFVLPLYLCGFRACRHRKCTGWYGGISRSLLMGSHRVQELPHSGSQSHRPESPSEHARFGTIKRRRPDGIGHRRDRRNVLPSKRRTLKRRPFDSTRLLTFAKHSFDNQMTTLLHPEIRSASPTFCRNNGAQMWMRSCAVCKALLKKLRLSDSTRCQCGWEWLGHP